jgi:hypothetical protein
VYDVTTRTYLREMSTAEKWNCDKIKHMVGFNSRISWSWQKRKSRVIITFRIK